MGSVRRTGGREDVTSTIPGRMRHWARTQPEKIFCVFQSLDNRQELTFSDLYERSEAYAAWYQRHGIQKSDLIVIILKHTPHLFYSYLGALLMGAVPTFMPFPSPKQRADFYWADHEKLFRRIHPALLVTYEENELAARAALPGFSIPTLVAGDEIVHEKAVAFAGPPLPKPEDVACLQHSSGTTSLKKGVMLTHRAVIGQVESYAKDLNFSTKDSIASWLPLYHDMGFIACFMASVILGTKLVALDPFEWVMRPHILLDAIERERTSFCWLPNFAFSHIVNGVRPGKQWDLASSRAFINCSEPCKVSAFERFRTRFESSGVSPEKLQVCYAMAENVFAVTQTPLERPSRILEVDADAFSLGTAVKATPGAASLSLVSCGFPIAGVAVEIRDENGVRLREGTIGQIFVSGDFLFAGYYKLPQETGRKLKDGWYATGDLGFVDAGELFVTGRMDDMLIVNGRNYYAHEIETIVSGIPPVIPGRTVAIGVENPDSGAVSVAVLAECPPGTDSAVVGEEVRRLVLEKLGLAVHTVAVLEPRTLVKTTSGKISRSKNLEVYLAQTAGKS